jgi:hypothetical protein
MRRARVAAAAVVIAVGLTTIGLGVRADNSVPYRLWWSFPTDDDSAIEVDDPDLSVSKWDSRWKFAVTMQKCDARKTKLLNQHRDGTPVREIRIEALDPDGSVRATSRCTLTLKDWRTRIGARLVERLEDELDAHLAFLMPRRFPGMPARVTLDGGTP